MIEIDNLPPTMTEKLSRNTTSNDSAMFPHKEPDSLRGLVLEQIYKKDTGSFSTNGRGGTYYNRTGKERKQTYSQRFETVRQLKIICTLVRIEDVTA